MKRLSLLAACVAIAALPASALAQSHVHIGVGVAVGGPHGGVAVHTAPRHAVVVGGYYGYPYYYGPWGWYGGPYWYGAYGWGAPYWYPAYPAYGPGYYYGGGASLRIQVVPRNAEVFIDGHFAGIVDNFDGFFQRLDLAPGEHDIELYLAGHRSVKQQVYLQPGKTFRVKYTMAPLQPGDPEPVRPTASEPPPPSDQQPPSPRAAQRPSPPVDAREQPRASGYGTLAVRVQPGDAEVLIDGERWAGSSDGDRLEVQLAAGVHNVEVHKNGFRSYATEVTVRTGQTATLNVALTRQ